MDIYAKEGTIVTYISPNESPVKLGNNNNPLNLLKVGEKYTVDHTEVHSFHTKVVLKEFPDYKFNSVHFD